jgi:hypothetical protein
MAMSEERKRKLVAEARETDGPWTEEMLEAALDEISTWPLFLGLVRLYKECPPND